METIIDPNTGTVFSTNSEEGRKLLSQLIHQYNTVTQEGGMKPKKIVNKLLTQVKNKFSELNKKIDTKKIEVSWNNQDLNSILKQIKKITRLLNQTQTIPGLPLDSTTIPDSPNKQTLMTTNS
tara:strand:+ start:757 stop:1125 length:369 start_codon:yes stop_codon:yes gene_type:complete